MTCFSGLVAAIWKTSFRAMLLKSFNSIANGESDFYVKKKLEHVSDNLNFLKCHFSFLSDVAIKKEKYLKPAFKVKYVSGIKLLKECFKVVMTFSGYFSCHTESLKLHRTLFYRLLFGLVTIKCVELI